MILWMMIRVVNSCVAVCHDPLALPALMLALRTELRCVRAMRCLCTVCESRVRAPLVRALCGSAVPREPCRLAVAARVCCVVAGAHIAIAHRVRVCGAVCRLLASTRGRQRVARCRRVL